MCSLFTAPLIVKFLDEHWHSQLPECLFVHTASQWVGGYYMSDESEYISSTHPSVQLDILCPQTMATWYVLYGTILDLHFLSSSNFDNYENNRKRVITHSHNMIVQNFITYFQENILYTDGFIILLLIVIQVKECSLGVNIADVCVVDAHVNLAS